MRKTDLIKKKNTEDFKAAEMEVVSLKQWQNLCTAFLTFLFRNQLHLPGTDIRFKNSRNIKEKQTNKHGGKKKI